MEPCNEIDLSVEQIPQNPIVLEDSSSTDYNTLLNKPSINNVELVGNKTAEDLGLSFEADSELSLTSENPVQNKVVTAALGTKQDTISDLATIRSGAALGATAVQPGDLATVATTGAYNDLTGKPGVMTGADGTNAGTSGLVPAPAATDNEKFLRGDGTWAEAGSAGGGTWGTITGTLSDQTDLQTALNAKADNFTLGEGLEWQAGRVLTAPDHIPPHVFTYDNLVAGNDLEINQIIDPYVLNEDTLACFHFDGDTTNAVSTGVTLSDDFKNAITGYTDPLVNPWYPGKSAAVWNPGNAAWQKLFAEDFTTFGTLEDYTLEFFMTGRDAGCYFDLYTIEEFEQTNYAYPRAYAHYVGSWWGPNVPRLSASGVAAYGATTGYTDFGAGTYMHFAIVRKNQVASVYVNGVLKSRAADSLNFKNFMLRNQYSDASGANLAEIVFSKVAKWDGNFTPPTAPYHQQEGGNQYEIKSTAIEKHATNCLTEVPRRVNLELSSGTMTLKAGSKVYVPNGSSTFDETTIANDITTTESNDNNYLCFTNGTIINKRPITACFSGSTAPTLTSITYAAWYDTSNNSVKLTSDGGSTWTGGFSLPFGAVTASGGALTSIDQVFNGFGYIGSTVFVLPGVKGYIPNGYNADGTLNNTQFETTAVLTTNAGYNNHNEVYSITENAMAVSQYYARQNDKPTTTGTLWYKPVENKMYRVQDDSSVIASNSCLVIETFRDSNGKITTFYPHTVMRMLDYNEYQDNPHIIETYHNGSSWYRVWSNGWCEQGGESNPATEIVLLKTFKDTNYTITGCPNGGTIASSASYMSFYNKTTNGFYVTTSENHYPACWEAKGYID